MYVILVMGIIQVATKRLTVLFNSVGRLIGRIGYDGYVPSDL